MNCNLIIALSSGEWDAHYMYHSLGGQITTPCRCVRWVSFKLLLKHHIAHAKG